MIFPDDLGPWILRPWLSFKGFSTMVLGYWFLIHVLVLDLSLVLDTF